MPTAGSTIANALHFAHDALLSADSAATEAEAKVYYPTNASLFSKTMWKTDLATGCNGGGYSALTPPSEARGASSNLGRANGTDITVSSFVHVSIYAGGGSPTAST